MPKMITVKVKILVNDENVAVAEVGDDIIEGMILLEDKGDLLYAEWWGDPEITDIHEATEEEMEIFWESI